MADFLTGDWASGDWDVGGGFNAARVFANQVINPLSDGMKKNVSGQKVGAQLVTAADGTPFTGSVTAAVTGDAGTQATGSVGAGACAHEGGGYHTYAPAQAETNYDLVAFTFSGTGAISQTVQIYTLPATGVLAPATAGRTLVVDAAGLADANMVKAGPTGSGTAQTAGDIFARLGAPAGASIAADIATRAPSSTALSTATWTGTRAGYLDNLSGGAVALASGVAVTSIGNNVITAASTAADYVTEVQSGLATASALSTLQSAVDALPEATDIANVVWDEDLADHVTTGTFGGAIGDILGVTDQFTFTGDNVNANCASLNGGAAPVHSSGKLWVLDSDGNPIATGGGASASDIADAVWDEILSGHSVSGSTGEALSAAGGAGDPWITALPGSYTAGQAGYILGTNLNATISSRASQTSVDDLPTNAELATALGTADDAVLAAIAALQSDTDNIQTRLPAALVSGRMDSSVGAMASNVITAASTNSDFITEVQSGIATASALSTLTAYVDTEVADILTAANAIKLKTDNLPASPAAVGSAMTLTSGERTSIADAYLDRANAIETGFTPRKTYQAIAALLAGRISTAGEDSEEYLGIGQASGTPRLVGLVDIDGNRTGVTVN